MDITIPLLLYLPSNQSINSFFQSYFNELKVPINEKSGPNNQLLQNNTISDKTKIYSISTNLEKYKRLTMKCRKHYERISFNKK